MSDAIDEVYNLRVEINKLSSPFSAYSDGRQLTLKLKTNQANKKVFLVLRAYKAGKFVILKHRSNELTKITKGKVVSTHWILKFIEKNREEAERELAIVQHEKEIKANREAKGTTSFTINECNGCGRDITKCICSSRRNTLSIKQYEGRGYDSELINSDSKELLSPDLDKSFDKDKLSKKFWKFW